ncbi:MAG TPA: hypothetical protein PLB59_12510 [Bacteroidales bacterium]|nr:hypothetical protein [Bacteroidales bacterium]HPI31395.1 hypothetical protein [Bacteroidales bacterium]HQN16771.1 hypothetical protein [Bacteroidales bacterium]HQP16776.1 hypothetical protein [Bacteroidales bacterium]
MKITNNVDCQDNNSMKKNFFTYSQKEQNYGQSEQILLERKWKEKIVEDDRCRSHFDTFR